MHKNQTLNETNPHKVKLGIQIVLCSDAIVLIREAKLQYTVTKLPQCYSSSDWNPVLEAMTGSKPVSECKHKL